MSALLQTPTPLFSQPVSASGAAAAKGMAAAVTTSAPFVATTTPNAILLHSASNQRCIASVTGKDALAFTVPAVFYGPREIAAEDEADEAAQDGAASAPDADADAGAGTADKPVVGRLVAASTMNLQVWKIDSAQTSAISKPDYFRKLQHPIQAIAILPIAVTQRKQHNHRIVAVMINGHVSLLSANVDRVLSSWSPPALKDAKSASTVEFSQFFTSETESPAVQVDNVVVGASAADPELGSGILVQVVRHHLADQNKDSWTVRLISVNESFGRAFVILQSEHHIELAGGNPLSYAFDPKSRRLSLLGANRHISVYELNDGAKSKPALDIDVSAFMDTPKANAQSPASLAVLPEEHIAVLSQRKQQDIITVWELKYGSLQSEFILVDNDAERPARDTRVLSLGETSVSYLGRVLVPLIASTESRAIQLNSALVPYHCEAVSLMSVLAKLSATPAYQERDDTDLVVPLASIVGSQPPVAGAFLGGQSVDQEDDAEDTTGVYRAHDRAALGQWASEISRNELLDSKYLAKLADPAQTATVDSFNAAFVAWLAKRSGMALQESAALRAGEIVPQIPVTELSHAAVATIARRCFTNPDKFWPRVVVEHLIASGSLTSQAVGDTANSRLLMTLIAKYDYDLVELALRHVCDLTEVDLARVLHHVCFATDSPAEDEHRSRVLDAYMARRPHPGAKELRRGRTTDSDLSSAAQVAEASAAASAAAAAAVKSAPAPDAALKTQTSDMDVDQTLEDAENPLAPTHRAITAGQLHFFRLVLSAPRNDLAFTHAMRSTLSPSDLRVLLAYLSDLLCPVYSTELALPVRKTAGEGEDEADANAAAARMTASGDRFPLWWLWSEGTLDETHNYNDWIMAVDALSLVIDSHLTTILLTSDLASEITRLQAVVKRDLRLLQLYDSRLRGPLLGLSVDRSAAPKAHVPLNEQDAAAAAAAKEIDGDRMHGKRWQMCWISVEVLKLL
ncbi:hypothetical protein BC831DRAFT_506397 [Entophlyctis helioformis]|nr:hypothetical protein BC831DRAFT_506397 [Entophlyctis helioformis]